MKSLLFYPDIAKRYGTTQALIIGCLSQSSIPLTRKAVGGILPNLSPITIERAITDLLFKKLLDVSYQRGIKVMQDHFKLSKDGMDLFETIYPEVFEID